MQQDLLLEANLKRLKLPAMVRLYLAVAREAAERNEGYVQYLSTLAEQEVIQREESGLRRRLKQAQFPVRFYTAAGLAGELLAAQQEYRLNKAEKQWLSYDLVVLDEVGYIPFTKTGAELLYQFCASRYERGSMIITTNLEFGKWTEVFGDENLTAALLDRLTHRCHILIMNGESYRFRESLRRQQAEDENDRKPA